MEVEFVLKCSMLEIYKETLYDLLNERNSDLKIKEHPQKGIYVDGLIDYVIPLHYPLTIRTS
jgi:kinesin family member 5